tara:strand:+ start:858 stop:1334 length:477 start_codon:yes stop_codon:yes gene_type:complete
MNEKERKAHFLSNVKSEYQRVCRHAIHPTYRGRPNIQHRCALANALRPYATTIEIGNLFEKDHSTVVHYSKEHEPMIKFHPEYLEKFINAVDITDKVAMEMQVYPIYRTDGVGLYQQIQQYEKTIQSIENRIEKLKKTLVHKKMRIKIEDAFVDVEIK